MSELFRYKNQQNAPAQLRTVNALVGSNEGATVTIPSPGDGWTVSPIRFRAFSRFMGTKDLAELVRKPVMVEAEERHLIIERFDAEGETLISIPTPLDYKSEAERGLQQEIDVAEVSRLSTLNNTGLRLTFNGYNAAYEWQYILLNYKVLKDLV